jgi:hypothetical protein
MILLSWIGWLTWQLLQIALLLGLLALAIWALIGVWMYFQPSLTLTLPRPWVEWLVERRLVEAALLSLILWAGLYLIISALPRPWLAWLFQWL